MPIEISSPVVTCHLSSHLSGLLSGIRREVYVHSRSYLSGTFEVWALSKDGAKIYWLPPLDGRYLTVVSHDEGMEEIAREITGGSLGTGREEQASTTNERPEA